MGGYTINPINGSDKDWKAFGQYFTPRQLSVIAAAAVLRNQQGRIDILDPSCGEGHMLDAAEEIASIKGIEVQTMGVELDPLHANVAMKSANIIKTGDAFNFLTANQPGWLPESYGGVVANPPYIRLDGASVSDERLLTISNDSEDPYGPYKQALSKHCDEHDIWSKLVSTIGGRADLSLAFWFLCVLNLKPGQRLAIITSDAWRTRDYGLIQRTLIELNLDVELIIKQPKNIWFPETQVSSSLVIARKIGVNETPSTEPFRLIHIDKKFNLSEEKGVEGICSKLGIDVDCCGTRAIQLIDLMYQIDQSIPGIINVHKIKPGDVSRGLISDLTLKSGDTKMLVNLLSQYTSNNPHVHPPAEMMSSLDNCSGSFEALSEYVRFKQGLRTGCDKAYYCTLENSHNYTSLSDQDELEVVFPKPLDIRLKIPKRYVKLCVKGQGEDSSTSKIALVVPHKSATSKDFALMEQTYPMKINDWKEQGLHVMPAALEEWVRRVEATNFGNEEKPKGILDHSVQRDMRNKVGLGEKSPKDLSNRDFPSWWYTLNLKPRHVPPMYFPRINGSDSDGGMCVSRDPGGLVISANFTTIEVSDEIESSTILNLFNTEWIGSHLEISCAPMGGGALKIERAHFQKLTIPKIDLTKRYTTSKEVDEAFATSLGMEYKTYGKELKRLKESFKSLRE